MKTVFAAVLAVLLIAPATYAQQTGWIGVSVEDGKDQGVVIRSVEANGPADKAGLKTGDLILEYNKTPVLGTIQFARLVRETPSGRTVDVRVHRDSGDQTLKVTTSTAAGNYAFRVQRPDMTILRDRMNEMRRDMPRIRMSTSDTRSGMQVDEMTSQLRTFFGVKGDDGVLVVAVDSGSVAEKAGLKAGDVITSVDNHAVRTPAEFDRQMRQAPAKTSMRIVRDKQERDITIERSSQTR